MILELILAIIGASYIWTIIHHINISKMKETIDSLNLARARIDENVHKLSLHIANVIEKDAKTGAEIVHKVLENGEKELVQVKNAAYQDWERIHKKINDDINQSLRDLDKDTQAVKRGVDIEKDKLANELAVKCGVAAKELSAEDNKIIEEIAKEENKV